MADKLATRIDSTEQAVITATTVITDYIDKIIPINASGGNINITLPAPTAVNAGRWLRFIRIDNSVNIVRIISHNVLNSFSGLTGNAIVVEMNTGNSIEFISINSLAVIKEISGISKTQRLWLPDDASTDPVVWYNFRNAGSLTLSGTEITGITNLGTGGAGFNLIKNNTFGPTLISNQYADFAGGARAMRTAASQAAFAGAQFSAGISYQQTAAENSTHFAHQLTSRLSWHVKWGDNNTYVDMPIASRISANLGSIPIGANPHSAVGIKGALGRRLHIDGNTTANITATGGGTALAGSGFLGIGATIDNTPGATDYYTGRMYEAVFFNIQISADERNRLAAYLLWSIGQQAQLDVSNPYKTLVPLQNVIIF